MLSHYIKQGALMTALYAGTSALMRCINFIFLPYFLTVLTLAEFGDWDFYQMLFVRGAIVGTSLAIHALIRFYFLYKHDSHILHQAISNACWLLAASSATILIAGIPWLMAVHAHQLAHLTLCITILYGFFSFIITLMRIQEKLGWYMILFCAQNLMSCGATILALAYGYKVYAFFYATICSLSIFLFIFMYILFCYKKCNWQLLKEQLTYSFPLLFYGIINVSFFVIDRFFIKGYFDPDAAGIYGILWRFGSIFQIPALSLVDAWPNIIFKAQQEENNCSLMRHLISYYGSFLYGVSLATLACSHVLFRCFMPHANQELCLYLPFFFASLTLYELARLLQTGLTLTRKTNPIPCIGAFCIIIQTGLFAWCAWQQISLNIWHIIGINMMTFGIYSSLSCIASIKSYAHMYTEKLFDIRQLCLLTLLFILFCTMVHINILISDSLFFSCLLAATWPFWVFLWCLNKQEKEKIISLLFGNPEPSMPPNIGKHTYSLDIHNKTVALIGPCPPLLGGVSIHLHRVGKQLEKQHNTVVYFDVNSRQRVGLIYLWHLILFLFDQKPDIVHFHTPYNGIEEFFAVLFVKFLLKFELVFIDHNCRYLYQKNWLYKLIYNMIMSVIDRHVLIGSVWYMYRDNGMRIGKQATIESPFLPPPTQEKLAILATYPPKFFTFCATHQPLLCANASGLVLLDNKDLYGFDTCIQLIASLKQEFPSIGMVLALAAIKDHVYFLTLKKLIHHTKTEDHIFFLHGQKELWPALEYIDLFIRPTLSDGLSLSIEEAQWAGKPVIASNASMRQPGTIIYAVENQKELHEKAKELLVQKFPHHILHQEALY